MSCQDCINCDECQNCVCCMNCQKCDNCDCCKGLQNCAFYKNNSPFIPKFEEWEQVFLKKGCIDADIKKSYEERKELVKRDKQRPQLSDLSKFNLK